MYCVKSTFTIKVVGPDPLGWEGDYPMSDEYTPGQPLLVGSQWFQQWASPSAIVPPQTTICWEKMYVLVRCQQT